MAKRPGKEERSHWASEFGSDEAFRAWIRTQPSCVSGTFSEFVDGQGRCVAAHVRRVGARAGTGFKPPFSCVPLRQGEHLLQHQYGEEHFRPLEWWTEQADLHLRRWVRSLAKYPDERDFRE